MAAEAVAAEPLVMSKEMSVHIQILFRYVDIADISK